jgi:hypothetical protein
MAATPPEAEALAGAIDAMLPPVRITELLHEVSRRTGFAAAFTNMRTGEACDNENALLAAILADATNLGLTRMAAASHGVTRDQLIWIADAYIRPETYKAALARIINAHHALPIAAIWGDGTTSSSDGQFFRSAKRGDAAGDVGRHHHEGTRKHWTVLSRPSAIGRAPPAVSGPEKAWQWIVHSATSILAALSPPPSQQAPGPRAR